MIGLGSTSWPRSRMKMAALIKTEPSDFMAPSGSRLQLAGTVDRLCRQLSVYEFTQHAATGTQKKPLPCGCRFVRAYVKACETFLQPRKRRPRCARSPTEPKPGGGERRILTHCRGSRENHAADSSIDVRGARKVARAGKISACRKAPPPVDGAIDWPTWRKQEDKLAKD